MKVLEPSPIWESIENGETFEGFINKVIPKIQPFENVPEAIKRRLGVIRKLLEFSYFEYEFIDVVMQRCYHTLELALQMKYKAKGNNKNKRNLKPLLDWAYNEQQKEALEYLRNYQTHPKEDTLGGMVNFLMIDVVCNQIINGLFLEQDKHYVK